MGSPCTSPKEKGTKSPYSSNIRDIGSENGAVKLGKDLPIIPQGTEGMVEMEFNPCGNNSSVSSDLVTISQAPRINLMVDLRDADCRRRRRRQISNLLTLHEVEENSQEVAPNSTDSEVYPIQSDSPVKREVLATMAVGETLGIKFKPNSTTALRTMIEVEVREYSLGLERKAERQAFYRLCGD